jgi:hypothetical protein
MDGTSTDGNGFVVNGLVVSRPGMNDVTCVSMYEVHLYGGGGAAKTHTVMDTVPGYYIYLHDGTSSDIIDVQATSGAYVFVDSTDLTDTLTVGNHGPATVYLPSTSTYLGTVDVSGDSVVRVGGPADPLGDGRKVLYLQNWSIYMPGQIDLGPHSMVVDYSTAYPGGVAAGLKLGYGTGSWDGWAIRTRYGDANEFALGYADSADILGAGGGMFHGVMVDDTAVLVSFTRYGDTNLDRVVDIGDFARLSANFNMPSNWYSGNFNYDVNTDISDFALMSGNFNQGVPADVPSAGRLFGDRPIEEIGLVSQAYA